MALLIALLLDLVCVANAARRRVYPLHLFLLSSSGHQLVEASMSWEQPPSPERRGDARHTRRIQEGDDVNQRIDGHIFREILKTKKWMESSFSRTVHVPAGDGNIEYLRRCIT